MPRYTLTLSTPSTGTPTFLHNLHKSALVIPFFGQYAYFFGKNDLSKWPWQHVMLLEGDDVKLPAKCLATQTLSWELDADVGFVEYEGHEPRKRRSMENEGATTGLVLPEDFALIAGGLGEPGCRVCVVVFSSSSNHKALQASEADLDMHIHLQGRITQSVSKLGPHAKDAVARKPKKVKANWFNTGANAIVAPTLPPAATDPEPTHLTLLSFPSVAEFGRYLTEGEAEGGVSESFILTNERKLPSKDEVICTNDWSWGNPHEPYGQDWFG
jgi:hypothetical protein